MKSVSATRRRVLTGAAAGGGLLVAWWLWPRRWPDPLQLAEGEEGFGGWLKIGRDGVVTLAVPQLEMGQGVATVLAQVAATELGADWRQMGVEMAPPAQLYANLPLAARWAPLWGGDADAAAGDRSVADFARGEEFGATAEGTSLAAFERPIREAAAAARSLLAMAAAERWGVAPEQCAVANGLVTYGPKRAGFGALVAEAAGLTPPEPPPLRPAPAAERVMPGEGEAGDSLPRLDLPAKVDGSFPFAGDIRLPGMVFASIRMAPHGDYELVRFDETAAGGLIALVRSKRWLAAVADSWWRADRALAAMKPVFAGPRGPDSAGLNAALDRALKEGEGAAVIEIGDAAARLSRPDLSATYRIAPAAHAGIETASATARFADGRLELWIASQAPARARRAAAKAVGLSAGDVVLYPLGAGGSFDARLEVRHAIQAAQIAKAVGRPVQLTWPRIGELQGLPPRAPMLARLEASFLPGSGGQIEAWRARIACPPSGREFGARLFGNLTERAALAHSEGKVDALAVAGAAPVYAVPHVLVEHIPVTTALPSARLRGNAPALTSFISECFLDELAQKAGRDPFLYRMGLLGQAPRMAEVLRQATRLAGWDGGGRGTGQGLAMAQTGDGGRIACVARASLSGGRVTVAKLTVAVELGRIVNLDIARQQIEGGLVFGMAMAMGGALHFEQGKPVERSLRQMALPALAQCPEIAVEILPSDAEPADPGELGVLVAPAAIANALHSATGTRFRSLPLLGGGT